MATVRDRAAYGPLDKSLDANAFAIVPNDTVNLPVPVDSIYVGGAGNITVMMPDGTTKLYTAPPVGTQLRVPQPIRVMASGTTATLLVGHASRALR